MTDNGKKQLITFQDFKFAIRLSRCTEPWKILEHVTDSESEDKSNAIEDTNVDGNISNDSQISGGNGKKM